MRTFFRLVPRPEPNPIMRWVSPILALTLTVVSGFFLFAACGKNPLTSLYVFFFAPMETLRGLSEVCLKMTPLLLCAAGLVVCFRANVWNIGAEGQLIFGAIVGGALALQCGPETGRAYVALVLIAGAVGGALWAALVAWLKESFHANEILVSLMLVYVAQFFLAYCVQGPLQDPQGLGFPQSPMFAEAASLPVLFSGTRLNAGFLIALAVASGLGIMMRRMLIGFELTVSGMAPRAAKYAGFQPKRLVWVSLLISGACAGLAGVCEVTGPVGQLALSISPGYGFAAIIVAFVARLSPLGCIPASFIMALFYLGGELAQTRLGLPSSVTGVYQGMLLFFLLLCDVCIFFRLERVRRVEA